MSSQEAFKRWPGRLLRGARHRSLQRKAFEAGWRAREAAGAGGAQPPDGLRGDDAASAQNADAERGSVHVPPPPTPPPSKQSGSDAFIPWNPSPVALHAQAGHSSAFADCPMPACAAARERKP